MGPINLQIEIDTPREEIFDFLCDLANRPAFTGPLQEQFRLERIASKGVGAAARSRARSGLGWMSSEITELESPHRIVERGRTGRLNRVPTTTVWELRELPSGVTEVSVIFFTQPANIFDRGRELLSRVSPRHRRAWKAALEDLRDHFESTRAVPDPTARIAGGNRHLTGIA